jgi:hypothetical protein
LTKNKNNSNNTTGFKKGFILHDGEWFLPKYAERLCTSVHILLPDKGKE